MLRQACNHAVAPVPCRDCQIARIADDLNTIVGHEMIPGSMVIEPGSNPRLMDIKIKWKARPITLAEAVLTSMRELVDERGPDADSGSGDDHAHSEPKVG
jgi:hypothetical protein